MNVNIQVTIPPDVAQQLLASNSKVATSFQVNGSNIQRVAWNATQPMPDINYQWQNTVGLYAAYGPVAPGVRINPTSALNSATEGQTYTYLAAQQFGPPSGSAPANNVGLLNQAQGQLFFGLTQTVSINGAADRPGPTMAASIFTNQQLPFPIPTQIEFFIAQNIESGVIISSPSSPSITVNTNQTPSVTLSFDGTHWSQSG